MVEEIVRYAVQFGVAGLMGILWVWERMSSRKYEIRLAEAHKKIIDQEQNISILINLVKQNTHAIERFEQTQRELNNLLRVMNKF